MTDIHLNKSNSNDRYNGLLQAIEKVKESGVDFIVIGGDVVDVSGMGRSTKEVADSMYAVYKETFDATGIEYFPTIGNHDRYFNAENGYANGDEIFKSFFGKSYYTFEKEGIRFFVLNSVEDTENKGKLSVSDGQLDWLKSELAGVDAETPIIVSTHVPVYSIYYPVVEGTYKYLDVIANYKEVLEAFKGHNLQLVLQGHQHLYEEIFSQDIQYITGGSVCAGWWGGAFYGTEEGFLIVEVDRDNAITWEYIDYGWTAKK